MRRSTRVSDVTRVIMHTPESRHGAAKYVSELVMALGSQNVPVVLFCPANFVYQDELRKAGIEVVTTPERPVSPAGFVARIFRNVRFVAQAALTQSRLVS